MKAITQSLLAVSAVVALAPAALSDKLVIEAGRIITQSGPEIVDGVIVIENGRISAVGPADEVEKPWDAPVLGGPDHVAAPGFVEAHSSRGLDRPNENVDVAPFLDVRDSVDPVAYYFEDCLRWGITTVNVQQGNDCVVGARGMIVRPVGMTVEEMSVRPEYGLKVSVAPKRGNSRPLQMQALRGAFDELRRYLAELVQDERDERGHAAREALFQGRELETEEQTKGRAMGGTAWKVEGLELIPRGAIDEKFAPLLELVEGRHSVFLHCAEPMDVPHALEVARENGFLARTTLVIDPSCWRVADRIAEAGVPVVLLGLTDTRRDPVTGEELETFAPTELSKAGVRFAFSSENSGSHSLWYQAALAIGEGMERDAALAAITTVPSEIIGMGTELGSIEEGKLGNVVLYSGDPLSVTSWVEQVVIEGREVYDRSEDVRSRHLLDGTRPPGTTSAGAEGEGHEHEHENEGGDEGGDEHGDDEDEDEEERD